MLILIKLVWKLLTHECRFCYILGTNVITLYEHLMDFRRGCSFFLIRRLIQKKVFFAINLKILNLGNILDELLVDDDYIHVQNLYECNGEFSNFLDIFLLTRRALSYLVIQYKKYAILVNPEYKTNKRFSIF